MTIDTTNMCSHLQRKLLYNCTKLFVYVNYFLYLCSVFNEYRYA